MRPGSLEGRLVLFRGGGEMASGAARLCLLAGFRVAILEREWPLAVRRQVCFAEAVFAGEARVEGVHGVRKTIEEWAATDPAEVAVVVDADGVALSRMAPDVLVDGRMSKTAGDTSRDQARVVIGIGPGFDAGREVHAVVETQRGPALGRVIWSGPAEADTAVPSPVLGVTEGRVLRAPRDGRFRSACHIGDLVAEGERVGEVEGAPVTASVAGLVRGMVADGVPLRMGAKLGDIDPRGRAVDPARVSDKARAVAAGVLEAALLGLRRL
jgi:xanthine dehydrogenase accessory factor